MKIKFNLKFKKGSVNNKNNKNARDSSARFLKRVINRDKVYVTPCVKRLSFRDDLIIFTDLYFDIKKGLKDLSFASLPYLY